MNRATRVVLSVLFACSLLTSCTPDGAQLNTTKTQAYSSNSNTPIMNTNAPNDSLDGEVTQAQPPAKGEDIAVITTNMGVIKVRFFPKDAPDSVVNFEALAKKGYYTNLIFHRVIEGFVMQGGDPTGTGTGGETATGQPLKDEKNKTAKHIFGAVAMAKSSRPNSATSQFYIVTNPSGTPSLDGGYTVFGQVFDGLNVVEQIGKVKTNANDKPLTDVVMQKVEIVPFGG